MRTAGRIVFFISYRLSFLVAKWKLAWSYWNGKGAATLIQWPENKA